eukprot:jgi/Botrbrau1/5318/Bobra.0391s0029.1
MAGSGSLRPQLHSKALLQGLRVTWCSTDGDDKKGFQAPPTDVKKPISEESHDQALQFQLCLADTALQPMISPPTVVRESDLVGEVWPGGKPRPPRVDLFITVACRDVFTDFRIDRGGASLWFHLLSGIHTFVLVPPTEKNLATYATWVRDALQGRVQLAHNVSDIVRLTLKPGDTLFLPGGWAYADVSRRDSIALKGNFLHAQNLALQMEIWRLENHLRVRADSRFPSFQQVASDVRALFGLQVPPPGGTDLNFASTCDASSDVFQSHWKMCGVPTTNTSNLTREELAEAVRPAAEARAKARAQAAELAAARAQAAELAAARAAPRTPSKGAAGAADAGGDVQGVSTRGRRIRASTRLKRMLDDEANDDHEDGDIDPTPLQGQSHGTRRAPARRAALNNNVWSSLIARENADEDEDELEAEAGRIPKRPRRRVAQRSFHYDDDDDDNDVYVSSEEEAGEARRQTVQGGQRVQQARPSEGPRLKFRLPGPRPSASAPSSAAKKSPGGPPAQHPTIHPKLRLKVPNQNQGLEAPREPAPALRVRLPSKRGPQLPQVDGMGDPPDPPQSFSAWEDLQGPSAAPPGPRTSPGVQAATPSPRDPSGEPWDGLLSDNPPAGDLEGLRGTAGAWWPSSPAPSPMRDAAAAGLRARDAVQGTGFGAYQGRPYAAESQESVSAVDGCLRSYLQCLAIVPQVDGTADTRDAKGQLSSLLGRFKTGGASSVSHGEPKPGVTPTGAAPVSQGEPKAGVNPGGAAPVSEGEPKAADTPAGAAPVSQGAPKAGEIFEGAGSAAAGASVVGATSNEAAPLSVLALSSGPAGRASISCSMGSRATQGPFSEEPMDAAPEGADDCSKSSGRSPGDSQPSSAAGIDCARGHRSHSNGTEPGPAAADRCPASPCEEPLADGSAGSADPGASGGWEGFPPPPAAGGTAAGSPRNPLSSGTRRSCREEARKLAA